MTAAQVAGIPGPAVTTGPHNAPNSSPRGRRHGRLAAGVPGLVGGLAPRTVTRIRSERRAWCCGARCDVPGARDDGRDWRTGERAAAAASPATGPQGHHQREDQQARGHDDRASCGWCPSRSTTPRRRRTSGGRLDGHRLLPGQLYHQPHGEGPLQLREQLRVDTGHVDTLGLQLLTSSASSAIPVASWPRSMRPSTVYFVEKNDRLPIDVRRLHRPVRRR